MRTVEIMRGRLFIPTSTESTPSDSAASLGFEPLPSTSGILIDQSPASPSPSSPPSGSSNHQTKSSPTDCTFDQTSANEPASDLPSQPPNLSVASFFNPDGAASGTIRLFNGRSFLSLPSNKAFHLVPDSRPSATVSTQTGTLKKRKTATFVCPMCKLKCRDQYDFEKHIDRMHTPHWFDDGGLECDRPFCNLKLDTKFEWTEHKKNCRWLCSEPECTFTVVSRLTVFITASPPS